VKPGHWPNVNLKGTDVHVEEADYFFLLSITATPGLCGSEM
jgi:hypothetical protein